MKKCRVIAFGMAMIMFAGIFSGCSFSESDSNGATDVGATVNVILADKSDQAAYAKSEIETAVKENEMKIQGDDADWTIELKGIDDSLEEEAYDVKVKDKKITVTGGDENGLMYGGLEVGEQIHLTNSISKVTDTKNEPDIKKRGVRFNCAMDMRTPDYSAPGDSYQDNIENTWDIEFWHKYFDELARDRYNVFTMWTLNPMPSMVKVADYPDIALDDVLRTTLPFDDTYSGTGNDNFRREHMDNYEVVKKMTIDEKIAFWKEVMASAKSRGIEFYIYFQNVCMFGEMGQFADGTPGKYGITADINNEVTKDYLRKSVAAMIDTYPDLDGIAPIAGENMPTIPKDDPLQSDRWIWETYGQGVNDALADEPDRDFLMIYTGVDIGDYWVDLISNATLSQRAGFASQHMNADADLMTVRLGGHQSEAAKKMTSDNTNADIKTSVASIMDEIPEGMPVYLDIRNEDAYLLRLGDVDYIRQMLTNFPKRDPYVCYTLGFAGYCQGAEYGYTDDELNGGLYIDKHWYLYQMIGRLGYDLSLSDDYIQSLFRKHFSDIDGEKVDKLFEGLTKASGIVREVNKVNYVTSSDSAFYPELGVSHPNTFGYLNVKRYMKSDRAEEGSNYMSIADYIEAYAKDGKEPKTDMVTPVEAGKIMTDRGAEVMEIVTELEKDKPDKYSSDPEREFYDTLDDIKAWSYWGTYYAEKFNGAIQLGIYNSIGDTKYQDASVKHLEKCLDAWNRFAMIYSSHYKAQRFGRHGYWDVNELSENVENDIIIVQTWVIRDVASGDSNTTATDKKVSEQDSSKGCVYAGNYDMKADKSGTAIYFDTFEIDSKGNVSGMVEDSGMTGFLGTIDENGHFECVMTRMKGGIVKGDIDENYHVAGSQAARGVELIFEGNLLY